MILELTDGRELQLPDEMPDETARMLGKLILRLEKRTQEAEAVVETLQAEIAALRDRPAPEAPAPDTSVAEAMAELRADLNRGFTQMIRAQLADRILVPDEFGEMTRSRAVQKQP